MLERLLCRNDKGIAQVINDLSNPLGFLLSPLRLPIPPLRHSNGQRATITPVTWGVKIARGKIARGKCRTAWAPTNHRPFGLLRLQEAGYDAAVSIA